MNVDKLLTFFSLRRRDYSSRVSGLRGWSNPIKHLRVGREFAENHRSGKMSESRPRIRKRLSSKKSRERSRMSVRKISIVVGRR